MAVLNPFDFFLEPEAERAPFPYARALEHESGPISACKCELTPRLRPITQSVLAPFAEKRRRCAGPRTSDFLVAVNQSLCARHQVSDPPGAGRADARRKRSSKAAAPAATRPGCWRNCSAISDWPPGLSAAPHQLVADVKSLDGPSGAEKDFTDLACLVRSLSARRGMDRTGPDFRLAGRRRPYSAGRPRLILKAPRRSPGRGRMRVQTGLRDEGDAHF